MHGLGAVSDSSSSEAEILQETHELLAVFGRYFMCSKVFIADIADRLAISAYHGGGLKVFIGRKRYHQTSGDIFCETDDLIREPGHILLADIGKKQVDLIIAGLCCLAFCGAGDTTGE